MIVSTSILSSKIKPQDIVKKLDESKCDYIHLDIMDGKFVDNKTWTISEIKKIISYSHLPLDVHLMVNNPEKYIEDYALLNTHYLTFHYEAVKNVNEMIKKVKQYGLRVGISINPETDVEKIFPYLKELDLVLVMGVHPGKSGQSFIEETPKRIQKIKNEIINQDTKTLISVDGGINNETGLICREAGCDILVSASYIHNDILNNTRELKKI